MNDMQEYESDARACAECSACMCLRVPDKKLCDGCAKNFEDDMMRLLEQTNQARFQESERTRRQRSQRR